MLNRRQLRIKMLQALYAYYQSDDKDIVKGEKELNFSINKMYEMYLYLLALVVEMQDAAIEKIEAGKNKKLPTKEELMPNTKFVTNTHLRALANSKVLANTLETNNISWANNKDLVKKVFKMVVETEDYEEYMGSDTRGWDHSKEFLLRFFKRHIINEESLHEFFEEKSIFWNDDLDLMAGMVIKTIKHIDEDGEDVELLQLWRDPEDEKGFMIKLFRETIAQGEENLKLIEKQAKNWETDRIALMDIILMKMGIAEAKEMETIPVKVTLNEYIELAKYYSTEKSHGFINGILDNVFTNLQEEGVIKKMGRGLVKS